jgi:CHAD domain-containing protein
VRAGDDPEDVHQARVATRRLRSDLRTFRRLLDPEWNAGLRAELRWAAAELGAVRDADVLEGRLSAQAAGLPPADAKAAAALLERLRDERAAARGELERAMRSPRWYALVDRLHDAAAHPKVLPDLAGMRAIDAVSDLVRRPWKHLAAAVDALGDPPGRPELHQVRIRAKRVRYALEAVAPLVGKRARTWAGAIAAVQELLGDMQDAVVAEGWLRAAAADDATGAGAVARAVAAGQLIAVQRRIAEERIGAWPGAWKAASAKKLRASVL